MYELIGQGVRQPNDGLVTPLFFSLQSFINSSTAPKNPPQIVNPQYRTHNIPNGNKKTEMSQSPVGENGSSSDNIDSFYTDSFNYTNSFNNTTTNNTTTNNTVTNNTISVSHVPNVNIGSADEKTEILAWLSPLDPWIPHHDIRAQRVEYVGDWLLQTEEYRTWVDGIRGEGSDNSVLFCHGDPGVGKTYIT